MLQQEPDGGGEVACGRQCIEADAVHQGGQWIAAAKLGSEVPGSGECGDAAAGECRGPAHAARVGRVWLAAPARCV